MIGWLCLLGGAFAAALSLNAARPFRGALTAFSLVGALAIAEQGAVQALFSLALGALFWALGATTTLPGLGGLALYGTAVVVALGLEVRALRSAAIATDALKTIGALALPPLLSWRLRPVAVGHRQVEKVRDLSYGPAGGRNRLDVYRPRGGDGGGKRPVLFQIHGGAWVMGDKDLQARPLLFHLAAAGWVCVAITYRFSPRDRWPAHLDDCRLALEWVREHIAEYGGDPDHIVVTGGSAGGHLATMLALTEPKGIAACVPFYAPYDLAASFAPAKGLWLARWICKSVFGCRFDEREPLMAASPMSFVNAAAPPFLVIHGTADHLVSINQARRFVAALRAVSKEPVLFAELPGAVHAFDMFRGFRTAATVAAVERFASWAIARPLTPAQYAHPERVPP